MVPARRSIWLLQFVTWVALVACAVDAWAGPEVFVLHNPIHPSTSQAVTYNATASDATGVIRVEIWEERRTLQLCANGQSQPPCSSLVSSTLIQTCTPPAGTTSTTCSVTIGPYQPPTNYVGYRVVVPGGSGTTTEGTIYYAVGPYQWTNDPIPIYVRGSNLNQKIDLAFIPDLDYGVPGSFETAFMNDVTSLIKNAYFSTQQFSQEIRNRRGDWNFYLTYQQGNAEPNCQRTKPPNWTNMRITVDTGFIVHTTAFSDCGDANRDLLWDTTFSAEPTSLVPAIHETGHAAFGLADEYSGGLLFENTTNPNVYTDSKRCSANKCNPNNSCKRVAGTFSRCDGATDLMADTSNTNRVFDICDANRIQWVHAECATQGRC